MKKKLLSLLLTLALIFCIMSVPAYAEGVIPPAGPIEVLADFGWVIFAGLCCILVALMAVYAFFKKPRAEQLKALKEWLLWAVIEAEKEFGRETGALKLRYVYDLFVATFPWLVKLVPFDTFTRLVDEALDRMKELLETNPKIKELVEPAGTEPAAEYVSNR